MNNIISYNDSEFKVMTNTAKFMVESGYFSDAQSIAKAFVKIQAGKELGLPPFASMAGIHIIQGKPVLGANVIATLVKNDHRYDYRIKQSDDKACILEWYELEYSTLEKRKVGEAGFTIQEANNAGLTSKDIWKKYASDMLFARAISRGARRFAPGIFGGAPVYTPDEMGVDTDEDGYIEVQSVTISDPITYEDIVDEVIEDAGPEALTEPMTIERAYAVTDSKGTPYGEIPSEKLSAKTIGINKGLKKADLTDEERAFYQEKLAAIRVLLQAREDGSI